MRPAIDLANYIVRREHLGAPTSSAESFCLLAAARIITGNLASRLGRIIGFRNVAVHEYQDLDIGKAEDAITSGTDDLVEFGRVLLMRSG